MQSEQTQKHENGYRIGFWLGVIANAVALITLYQNDASWPIWFAVIPSMWLGCFGGYCLRSLGY